MKVKYSYQAYKRAKKKKLINEYLFFLQLNSIHFPQNELIAGTYLKAIQDQIPQSKASVSLQMKALIKAGFLEVWKNDDGSIWKYVLKSYKKVHNLLGFRFKEKGWNRIERFKFDFVEVESMKKSHLKQQILRLEIIRNKKQQLFKAAELLFNKLNYHKNTITSTKSEKVKKRKESVISKLETISSHSNPVTKRDQESMTNKISCKKIASLLGYKSPMSSLNIIRGAEKSELVSVKRVKALIATGVSRVDFSVNPLYEGCYWLYGKVYKNECNIYSFPVNVINRSVDERLHLQLL